MRLRHRDVYKHTNRTFGNTDGARGKGYAKVRTVRTNKDRPEVVELSKNTYSGVIDSK